MTNKSLRCSRLQVAQAHLSYVELKHVGQAFRMGRYPIHFHLNGNMDQSYVRGCTIRDSFNRAVNIHGTHNTLVSIVSTACFNGANNWYSGYSHFYEIVLFHLLKLLQFSIKKYLKMKVISRSFRRNIIILLSQLFITIIIAFFIMLIT